MAFCVMYHHLGTGRLGLFNRLPNVGIDRFVKQLDFFQEKYRVLPLHDFLQACQEENLASEREAVLLTFDDGLASHFEHAYPMLKARGLSGAFFPSATPLRDGVLLDVHALQILLSHASQHVDAIYDAVLAAARAHRIDLSEEALASKFPQLLKNRFDNGKVAFIKKSLQLFLPPPVRREVIQRLFAQLIATDPRTVQQHLYATENQLREMARHGMTIGGHSDSHPWMSYLDAHDIATEVGASSAMLDRLGVAPGHRFFCYPYGSYNDAVIESLKRHGFEGALSTRVGAVDRHDSLFDIPRYDVNDICHE